ncbi:AAA family ATPase [Solwaraspora sp. WMMD1047]|uniref:ATP-binding protein n=1 Tax=Solwaraspora sp. WMMD1047 TaxID=3016102 RepID=UPI002416EE53|nr:AAA family ATPase [Solwaraspora sp. WMMD1047]MDG4828806.1 AAA family ATPase [Solwaraspora sp. WMMD1047]
MSDDPLITSLTAAVQASPGDLPLRLHLAGLLLDAGRTPEAITHLAGVLASDPGNGPAQTLMQRALSPVPAKPPPTGTDPAPDADPAGEGDPLGAFERELADVVPPRYAPAEKSTSSPGLDPAPAGSEPEPVRGEQDGMFEVESAGVRLADVGGMTAVKERLELAFLGPLRNPELRKLFGKSLRGGLMLYGPPGCGKTFLARAVAGEMGAKFISLSIVDVLDIWIGRSERNLHELFQAARRNAPCVLFLDEVDALGQKRSRMNSSSMRTVGNQLLAELDGVEGDNDGLFVLAATNTPWEVDTALRRPGRLDRMVLVLPPDVEARDAILRLHLRDRPIAGIDLPRIVAATEDFSGADLAHLCETAAEYAMADSIRTGEVRMIEQRDFDRAVREIRPSTRAWFDAARNVAMFANEGGVYDDLVAYLKQRKLL